MSLPYLHCTYRFVHAFTCAGVLPTKYIHFSKFAGVGNVGHGYVKQGILDVNLLLQACVIIV